VALLYFLLLPQKQGSLRAGVSPTTRGGCGLKVGCELLLGRSLEQGAGIEVGLAGWVAIVSADANAPRGRS